MGYDHIYQLMHSPILKDYLPKDTSVAANNATTLNKAESTVKRGIIESIINKFMTKHKLQSDGPGPANGNTTEG